MATTRSTWTIDPVHSSVEFSLDYMDPDLLGGRDHPTITFKSTRVEAVDPPHWTETGDLTIHGVAQPVVWTRAISARPRTRSARR